MSDYPATDLPLSSVISDSSRGPITENVVYSPAPSYGFVNPSTLDNTNNVNQKPAQYQPQWGAAGNVEHTPNIYVVPPTVANQELNQVESYTVWSVLNIFFCCWILGCVACAFSLQTNNAKERGDLHGALSASRTARTINIISTVLGVIIYIIYILYYTGTF